MGCVGGGVRTFAQGHDFEANDLQTVSTSQCQTQRGTAVYTSNTGGTERLRAYCTGYTQNSRTSCYSSAYVAILSHPLW
jgi:hypothetical protein